MKKNELITEQNTIQNVQVAQNVTKEQVKEIAIKAFEKYFNQKVDVKNLFEEAELQKFEATDNYPEASEWYISWSTFDISKLKDIGEKLEKAANSSDKDKIGEEFNKLNDEYSRSLTYYATIDGKSGNILDIGIKNDNISAEELKEKTIALNELEKFAAQKIDITNLNEEISVNDNKYIFRWNNEVDRDGKEKREINYAVTINKETGEAQSILYRDEIIKQHKKQPIFEAFNIEAGKKVASDFIEKHKYIDNINNIKFLRYSNANPEICLFNVEFTYGKDEKTGKTKVISVTIDKSTNKVECIGKHLETDEELKSKDHERTNKAIKGIG